MKILAISVKTMDNIDQNHALSARISAVAKNNRKDPIENDRCINLYVHLSEESA